MGRHRSKFRKTIDPKPRAFSLLTALTRNHPQFKSAIGFYPGMGWPAAERVTVLHDSVHRFPLAGARYAAALAEVSQHCVDGLNPASAWPDEWTARRLVALVSDVRIPGHTLTPADALTGKQVAFGPDALSNWHHARPAPALRRVRIDGLVCAVPPLRHFGHLLTDFLFPLLFAAAAVALPARTLTVVTPRDPFPLILAFVGALRHLGLDVAHRELSLFETVEAETLLHARAHSCNIERLFSFPEMLPAARAALLAACGGSPIASPPARLYLTRGRTKVRQVAGEDALIAILRNNGFTIFKAEWGNLASQIGLFAGASTAVGVHGAGMANLLWGSPEALAIEIMALDARKSTGLHWASEAGMDYACLFGSREGERQSFAVDPQAMAADIIALAERREAQIAAGRSAAADGHASRARSA